MRSEHSRSHVPDRQRWSFHPNGFFLRNTLRLLGSLALFCWICGAAGNLLRTNEVAHFDWLNLSLAYIWTSLSMLAISWLALLCWELTYVTRPFPRPLGVGLLVGAELLCGWLGWRSPPVFTPFPPVVSLPFALVGLCADSSILAVFLCLVWDRLQGPRSWRFEHNRMGEGWKTFFHPSPFLRRYYSLLYHWHDLRQMMREDAKRGRPMNELEFLQERIRRLDLLEKRGKNPSV